MLRIRFQTHLNYPLKYWRTSRIYILQLYSLTQVLERRKHTFALPLSILGVAATPRPPTVYASVTNQKI